MNSGLSLTTGCGNITDNVDGDSIKDVRGRAGPGVVVYARVRESACVRLDVGDGYSIGKETLFDLKKGGQEHRMPVRHPAVTHLDALTEADTEPLDKAQKKLPLSGTSYRRNDGRTDRRLDRRTILSMVKARALDAGITAPIMAHSPGGTATTFLESGGQLGLFVEGDPAGKVGSAAFEHQISV